MFDGEISEFLGKWRTLRGVDEQNIESFYPQFNFLVRRFGSNCGGRSQQLSSREIVSLLSFEVDNRNN